MQYSHISSFHPTPCRSHWQQFRQKNCSELQGSFDLRKLLSWRQHALLQETGNERMLYIFINIFVVSLSLYQLWSRKTFSVKSCLSKLSSTSLSTMTRAINQTNLLFFHIPWWESLLKASCLYLCSIQALVRLRELQIWRLFIVISCQRVFHGNYIKINTFYPHVLFEGLSLLFSRLVIEQQYTASMFIGFEIGQWLNHICNCSISFPIAFGRLNLPSSNTQEVLMLTSPVKTKTQLQGILSIVLISFFTVKLLMKMSPISNWDLITLSSASLSLRTSENATELWKSMTWEHPDYT